MFMIRLKRKGMFFCKANETVAKKLRKRHYVRKTLSVILSVILILVLMPQKAFGIDDYIADNGNWTINTAQGFIAFRDEVNSGNSFSGKTVTLANNLDFSSVCDSTNPWVPTGNSNSNKFCGSFEGNGKEISGLYLDGENDYTGLFGYIGDYSSSNTSIKNLTLKNVNSKEGSGDFVGGLCGYMYSNVTISNCSVIGTIQAAYYVGGICGFSYSDSNNIENCFVDGEIYGSTSVGGICGRGLGKVSSCASFANVSGEVDVGGIWGSSGPTINNCYSAGTIKGENEVGGIFGGGASSTSTAKINNCYSIGTIDVTGYTNHNGETFSYGASISGAAGYTEVNNCMGLSRLVRGVSDSSYYTINRNMAIWRSKRDVGGDPNTNYGRTDMELIKSPPEDGVEIVDILADGEDLPITPGWQQRFIDSGWDQEIWYIITLILPNYSIAALPILKKINVEQHPLLPHVNDFYYLCKAEDVNLLPADVPRFDQGDGYFRLWKNEDFYDYKKGTPLKIVDPIVGWVPKDDPTGEIITEFAPAEEYSKREIVASFGAAEENVFEAPVGDGTIVKVVDPYNQISKTWRLVVEPVNDDLQSHGYDHALAAETEHGKLFLIYFVNEKDEKVGEVNLDKPVRVMVPVPDYYDINDLKVFFVDPHDKDTEHKLIGTEMMGDHNYAVFETSHFSPYALIDILNEQEKAERANSKNPATSDELYTTSEIIVASGTLAGAFLVLFAKFASSRKKKSE